MLEQIDRILQTGIAVFTFVYLTSTTFKALQKKHSDRTKIWLTLSSIAIVFLILLPPMLIATLTIILLKDPDNWLGVLLPIILGFIGLFVTHKVTNGFFLR